MDGSILNAFATLSTVVAALGVLLYIVKRAVKIKNSKDQILDMKVLSRMPLNQKNQLYIVQAGNKKLLLGVSDTGIRNLSEIDDEIPYEIPKNTPPPKQTVSKVKEPEAIDNLSFRSFLKSTFSTANN